LKEWTAQAFLTNDLQGDADELAHEYDGCAGIEPLTAELKGVFGIGESAVGSMQRLRTCRAWLLRVT